MDFYPEDRAALRQVFDNRQTKDAVKKAIYVAASAVPELSVASLDRLLALMDSLAEHDEEKTD